jgi:hypothetical protein
LRRCIGSSEWAEGSVSSDVLDIESMKQASRVNRTYVVTSVLRRVSTEGIAGVELGIAPRG